MENDKYCNNCDLIPESVKAIYCELCGLKLSLFSDRYCDAGCEISPFSDDKLCSKCGNDLLPLSKNRICSQADCDRTIPQDQLIQLLLNNYNYKNQLSEWQDNFEIISQLCIPHFFQSKHYTDWHCKFDNDLMDKREEEKKKQELRKQRMEDYTNEFTQREQAIVEIIFKFLKRTISIHDFGNDSYDIITIEWVDEDDIEDELIKLGYKIDNINWMDITRQKKEWRSKSI